MLPLLFLPRRGSNRIFLSPCLSEPTGIVTLNWEFLQIQVKSGHLSTQKIFVTPRLSCSSETRGEQHTKHLANLHSETGQRLLLSFCIPWEDLLAAGSLARASLEALAEIPAAADVEQTEQEVPALHPST